MSTKDPLDPYQDPDRTVLVPMPGGKRPTANVPTEAAPPVAAPPPFASPAIDTHSNPGSNTAPPSTSNQRPQSANATATGGGAASVKLHGDGLNPLVAAANPLLDLVLPLRHMVSYPQVENLRLQLVAAIKTFEAQAKAALVEHEAIAAARYSLCTFLDETISSTPWGGGGVWASRSLLVTFHNEAFGGEKFFLILQKLCQDPRANIQTLELMYLCIALGLEGRYRVIEGGRSQLEILRERLQQLIQKERGTAEPELSVHWMGASGKGESLWRMIPVWVIASIAAVFLLLLQLLLSYRLSHISDPVFENIHKIKVDVPAPIAVQPVALPAKADPILTYNHVDLSYQWTHYSDSAVSDANGLTSGVQFSPVPNFFLEGGYEYQDTKIKHTDTGISADIFNYGMGAYTELEKGTHLVGHIGGLHGDVEADGGGSASDDAFYGTVEVRYALNEQLELDPFLGYDSLGDNDTWTYGVNAVYALNNSWALTAGIDGNNDSDLDLRAGARWSFDCGTM